MAQGHRGALTKLARANEASLARVHESVHRRVWAVEDAFCDWREHGEPLWLG